MRTKTVIILDQLPQYKIIYNNKNNNINKKKDMNKNKN